MTRNSGCSAASAVDRPDLEIHAGEIAVGLDAQTGMDHRFFFRRRFAQGGGQAGTQSLAGHFQDVQASLARRRLQILAGASMQVQDIADGR